MAAKSNKHELIIDGMHCDACELFMEEMLKKQQGVNRVTADAKTQKVTVTLDEQADIAVLKERVNRQIAKRGYQIVENVPIKIDHRKQLAVSGLLAASLVGLFLLLQTLNITSLAVTDTLSYPTIFVLGIVASLSTCMAVVGGVAMTASSRFAQANKTKAITVFHVARLVGFIVLGGVMGYLGRIILVSAFVASVLRVLIAVVMTIIGLDMLGIRLPKLVLPKSIAQSFGIFDDKDGWTGAVVLGVATFFLPCAFTQSMQLYAISTGSFVQGTLVMGAFALGTLPVLGLVSYGSANGAMKLGTGLFGYTMGFLLIFFSLLNIYSSLGSWGLVPLLSFL